jgi:hypothetical protein
MNETFKYAAIACTLLLSLARAASAQTETRPGTLATLFEGIYGPSGLRLSSDDVQLDGSNHAAHFNSAFQSEFRLVNIALASQLAAVPLPSPASGFTYRFDPATGTFVRTTTSFGPIFTDRGETIGRGRLAFGFNYQFLSFDHLDGASLAAIPAVFRHDAFEQGGGRADVVGTDNTIEATVNQLSAALTYGLSDRVDLSVAVPIVRTRLSLLSTATIYRVGTGDNLSVHYFKDDAAIGGYGSTHQFFSEGSAGGLGDIVARAKSTVVRKGHQALALGLDVRMPTGDEQNLLGSGATGVRPFAAYSTSTGSIAPHVNVGYQWNGNSVLAGDVKTEQKADLPDQFMYAIGGDGSLKQRITLVADLIGQRVIDSPRLVERQSTYTGPAGSVTLDDITFETVSYWTHSVAIGMKANVAARVLLNFNLRFQLGKEGLADRLVPLLGLEWGF